MAQKPAPTPIPVQLSTTEFTAFILPHLSMSQRGPQCKLGYIRLNVMLSKIRNFLSLQHFMVESST
jgi:hypothetical protein